MECTRTVHLTGAILFVCLIGLLPSITAWAGTFEAAAIVEADPDGTFSYEAIYTPGADEALDFESIDRVHNTVGRWGIGDGFCEIPLEEGVPYVIPVAGWLVDPTSLGIVRAEIGTCPFLPTPTAPPTSTPLPLGEPITELHNFVEGFGDTIIIEGWGGAIDTTIVPFGSTPCSMGGSECTFVEFCETLPGACDGIGLCAQLPEVCPVYDPACGCDGNTYDSACEAARAGVSVESFGGPCVLPTPTPTPTAPPGTCANTWPESKIVTMGKGQSPTNNAKVHHVITGHIVNPGSVGETAHRIEVCSNTEVTSVVSDTTGTPTNTANGTLTCNPTGCSGFVSAKEKYQSRSADGRDRDSITFIPR